MTYEEARRRARQMFGSNAEVKEQRPLLLLRICEVGVVLNGVFKCLGVGETWEMAFSAIARKKT